MRNSKQIEDFGSNVGREQDSGHVVFLGTFNAMRFQSKIENWLPFLDLDGTSLLIADNCSTDDTVGWLGSLIKEISAPAWIVQNTANFGGYGSLASNLDRMASAKWVTTLHQDDRYSTEHVQKHIQYIASGDANVGMIFSEAKSVDQAGKSLPFPRAHWLLESADPITVFLAHLRNHAFPFSGATFLVEMLRQFPIPWHSTAFPDTELVMKTCLDYKSIFADGVTVEYLENPTSESHIISAKQRDFGAFQALARVFSHPSFVRLCNSVENRDRDAFVTAIREGIGLRFEDPTIRLMMQQLAMELICEHFGPSRAVLSGLLPGYESVADDRAISVLIEMGASSEGGTIETTGTQNSVLHSKDSISILRRASMGVSLLLPRRLRKALFKHLMSTKFGQNALEGFKFNWRGR